MRYVVLFTVLLFGTTALAAPVVVCDPTDAVVPHRVTQVIKSANTPDFTQRKDAVVFNRAQWEALDGTNWREMRCQGGDGVTTPYRAVEQMSALELVALQASQSGPGYQETGVLVGQLENRPTCNSDTRGRLYVSLGAPGVGDTCFICLKLADGTGAWGEIQVVVP